MKIIIINSNNPFLEKMMIIIWICVWIKGLFFSSVVAFVSSTCVRWCFEDRRLCWAPNEFSLGGFEGSFRHKSCNSAIHSIPSRNISSLHKSLKKTSQNRSLFTFRIFSDSSFKRNKKYFVQRLKTFSTQLECTNGEKREELIRNSSRQHGESESSELICVGGNFCRKATRNRFMLRSLSLWLIVRYLWSKARCMGVKRRYCCEWRVRLRQWRPETLLCVRRRVEPRRMWSRLD